MVCLLEESMGPFAETKEFVKLTQQYKIAITVLYGGRVRFIYASRLGRP